MSKLLPYLFCFFAGLSHAQQIFIIIDAQTKDVIPFAKVVPNNDPPQMSDIDGKVSLDLKNSSSFKITFFEYKDTLVSAEQLKKEKFIGLIPDLQYYDEVIITPGENPAHRIIRNAMNERKNNDPMRNNSFSYESFSRFYLTGEPTQEFDRDTITDSSWIRTIEFFDKQYIFLTETAAYREFNPPNYDKEEVTSYKVSGLKDPLFATLVNQLQSFSFYDNVFNILGSDYINPIAPGSIKRYFFLLEDTLVRNQDTTYTISFRPSKGKNFEGLKGYLYINTKGWALERVIAEPYEQKGFISLKTTQEYRYTNDQKWFPYNISTEFQFGDGVVLGGDGHQPVGRSNLYIKNVQFDIPIKKKFNAIQLEVSKDAEGDTLGLEKARGEKTSDKERATYHMMDSVSKEANFDRTIEAFKILSTGKIPIKKLSFPLNRLLQFNNQEGLRLGLGAETNRKFSKHVGLGGYFAYGFGDKAWKWGGNMDFNLYERKDIKLSLLYSDDVFERGGVNFRKDDFDLTTSSSYRNLFLNSLDRERKASVMLSGLVTPNFKVKVFGDYRRIQVLDDYVFSPAAGREIYNTTPFDLAETGVIITWNLFEKVMMLGDQRVSLGTKFPKLTFQATKGWDNIFLGEYDYTRFNLEIDQSFSIRGLGRLTILSRNGLTQGNTPLFMNHVAYGSAGYRGRVPLGLSVINTFETMLPAEFMSDRFSHLFVRMTFLPFKNKTKWTEPQISLHSAAGYGAMNNRFDHQSTQFSVPDKGFFESGVIVDNIYKFGFNGFGLGVFYRYGAYAFPTWQENLMLKLSFKFNF